ncbi:uncharacterized membrane protein YgaE (UPF0421/DUF939 family) [Enterococcus sp. PF1-24]|uniref:aromatic acid exporter family protein n=1 Tax=unclassified Enterococcus TaxID=2608891 RepID=UPI00247432E2|nr:MULTISPECIES: aromatic acid exporter family protein [unclassified Enterococcus]MDH6365189.1 uncharacterized membrane protein YgaE (UPF0421/DUF939 family) [Enterococcus sp. PFB1-1]MDH6402290.1 uncharacterized membrane protein YgaE (UPF0421/DUF939 family) [Enterococcus sp. PF1-24]
MHIGLRTIKTAVSATLAILLANFLQLSNPTSAGIIAVLSLTNTKRSSIETGVNRLVALALATLISSLCFTILGYRTIAFGIYLLLFITLTVKFKLSDGIVVCSVLVTHYLTQQSMDYRLIFNEFALMIIGVGFALLMNLHMPNIEKDLQDRQAKIELSFREIFSAMAVAINHSAQSQTLCQEITELKKFIRETEALATQFQENHWFNPNLYYVSYFSMRRTQAEILLEMSSHLQKIAVAPEQVQGMQSLLELAASTFAEENDGQELLAAIFQVYEMYRQMSLPQTRDEFENRAELFQFLQLFTSLIEIKAEFAQKENQE